VAAPGRLTGFVRGRERAGIDVGSSVIVLLVACLPFLSLARGAERVGDTTFMDSYQQHARNAIALENEIGFLIGIAPDEEHFNLYWTYNHFIGTWLQVELLQAQLTLSVGADSPAEEEATRTTLRDQAQFALWELEQTEMDLERNIPELTRPDHLRINRAIRALVFEVRTTIGRLLFEQCARISCAPGP
jgi:AAA+ ATPase superfamily predicted ATPase